MAAAKALCVVIPCLNEGRSIRETIQSIEDPRVEVLVVDCGSTDNSVQEARSAGAKVITSERGRGRQLNVGWRSTQRAWCLFLHGDSRLPQGYLDALSDIITPGLAQQGSAHAASHSHRPGTLSRAGGRGSVSQDTSHAGSCQGSRRKSMTGPGADQASEHANAQSSIMTVGGGSQQGGCGAWRLPFDLVRGWMPGAPGWSGKDQDSSGHDSSNGSSSVSPSSTSQSSYAGGLGKASQAPAKWGCFSTIQTEFSDTLEGRILSFGVGLRTRVMGLPYGDQAMFVERRTLEELDGFREWPLLEDVDLVKRLKQHTGQGPAVVDLPILTSGRRWQKLGFWRTALQNQCILVAWKLGVDVHTLASVYYGKPLPPSK